MPVCCPHCQRAIEKSTDASFRELHCTSCGRSFDIVDKQNAVPNENESTEQPTTIIPPYSPSDHPRDETVPLNQCDETATIGPGHQSAVTLDKSSSSHNIDPANRFGDYEIIKEIARGGMGVVYKARQISLNRTVALKKILAGQLAGAEDIERFRVEAEASANLDHPGIVPVHDFGAIDGQHYFSMGYVEGRSLADWINESPLEPREAAQLLIRISHAVAHANAKGVIHRDLKPGNVLIDQGGEPRVTDFGLAKRQDDDSGRTATGQILGTPSYMPPEQASGDSDKVDQRADIYALGAILYATLTGRPPFQAANATETMIQVLERDPISVRQLVPSVPKDLETICLKCIRKEVDKRYDSAKELADDLQRWLDGEPIVARRVSKTEKALKWCRRNPAIAGTVAALFVSAIVVAVVLYSGKRANDRQRLVSAIDALETADGSAVPFALAAIDDFPRKWAVQELTRRFSTSEGQVRLNLAYGLAHFDLVEIDTLVECIRNPNTSSNEVMNLVTALIPAKSQAVEALEREAVSASADGDWRLKARLATIALYLGDDSIAADMVRTGSDDFLKFDFPDDIGRLSRLADSVNDMATEQRTQEHVRLEFAFACYYIGRTSESIADLNELARVNHDSTQYWILRALCFAREGHSDAAREAADRVAERFSEDPSLDAYYRIIVEAWLGELETARQELEKFVEDHPDNGRARYIAAQISSQLARISREKGWRQENHFKQRAIQLLFSAYVELGLGHGVMSSRNVEDDVNFLPLRDDYEFRRLVSELRPQIARWNPVERTRFISEFPKWAGDFKLLATSFADCESPQMRSGIALAVGRIDHPSEEEKTCWESVLSSWYLTAPDAGTHSAAGWALRQWDLSLPLVATERFPTPNRDWWNAGYITFVRVSGDHVSRVSGTAPSLFDYWMSDREVTVGLFRQFLNDAEYVGPKPDMDIGAKLNRLPSPNLPVHGISWYDAVMFCNWMSSKLEVGPCYEIEKKESQVTDDNGFIEIRVEYRVTNVSSRGIRLPKEAEWEFACRGGTATRFGFGDDEVDLSDYAWFAFNSNSHPHLVATKQCNAWGLFDMHGNVMEWCEDGSNTTTWQRGGSWQCVARDCTSSARIAHLRESIWEDSGFRVVLGSMPEDLP